MQRSLLAIVLAACTLVIGRQFWIFGTAAPFSLPLLAGCLAAATLGFRAAALTLIVSGIGIAAPRFPELLGISLLQPHYVTQALLFLVTGGLVLMLSDRDERMRARLARQEEESRWLGQSWPGEDALFWRLDPGALRFIEVKPLKAPFGKDEAFGYPIDHWRLEAGFWQKHLHPEDRQRTLRALKGALRAPGERFELTHRLISPSGHEIELCTSFIAESGGRIVGVSSSQTARPASGRAA